jgi:hypothetical protein
MGPTSGGDAVPTFRKILLADIIPATATMTLVNADNDNVLGTDAARVYLIDGPTKAFTISGISGGTDGRVIHVINRTGQNLTFENEEATSDAANRIVTSTGADIATTGNGSGILTYITGTLNRWVLTATSL